MAESVELKLCPCGCGAKIVSPAPEGGEEEEGLGSASASGDAGAVSCRGGQPEGPALTADFTRAYPGGVLDDSTFEALEEALDRADAPIREDGRWLTLPERVDALAAALPPDVVRLVIAARAVAFEGGATRANLTELDEASEAFATRVPWENDPATTQEAGHE